MLYALCTGNSVGFCLIVKTNSRPGVSQALTPGKPMTSALVSGDVPMATQRKVEIIIAATAMFHVDTHTE